MTSKGNKCWHWQRSYIAQSAMHLLTQTSYNDDIMIIICHISFNLSMWISENIKNIWYRLTLNKYNYCLTLLFHIKKAPQEYKRLTDKAYKYKHLKHIKCRSYVLEKTNFSSHHHSVSFYLLLTVWQPFWLTALQTVIAGKIKLRVYS